MPRCCRRRHRQKEKDSLKEVVERCDSYVECIEKGNADPFRLWRVDANDESSLPPPWQAFPRVKVTSKASLLDKARSKSFSTFTTPTTTPSHSPVKGRAAELDEEKVEARLAEILNLCRKARVFEAHALLQAMVHHPGVQSKIASQPLLCKLMQVHHRFQDAIKLTMTPALREDVAWRTITVRDAKVHKDWTLEFALRHADDLEFQKGGPSSQIIIRTRMFNYPLSLAKYMSLSVEVDQGRKEWVEDCDFLTGICGGEAQLYEGCCQMVIASSMMPFHLQETMLRAISYCAKPPFDPGCLGDGAGKGVLTVESNPPDGVKEWEGWTLPPDAKKKVVRLSGTVKTIYAMPGADPSLVNVFAATRLHLPVRPFLLPLDLAKRVVAELFRKSIVRVKEQVFDKWKDYDFDARRKANSALYKQFESEVVGAVSGQNMLFVK